MDPSKFPKIIEMRLSELRPNNLEIISQPIQLVYSSGKPVNFTGYGRPLEKIY